MGQLVCTSSLHVFCRSGMSAPQLAERASTKPSVVHLNIEITLTWCQCNNGVALLGGAAEHFFLQVSLWFKPDLLLLCC